MRRWALLAVVLMSGCGSDLGKHVPFMSDEQAKPPPESAVVLPPYPQEKDLLQFPFGPTGSHRYFVDTQSISVGADGVVRYTVVVKTTGGAVNTSYEGIRCMSAEKRLYAIGVGQKWIPAKISEWTDIRRFNASHEHQAVLFQDYFCRGEEIVRTREDAVRALWSGPR